MHLTRLVLDARNDDVRRDLSDANRLHQRVMSAFPDGLGEDARAKCGVLYRVESLGDQPVVLVQSAPVPDWSRLPKGWLASTWDGAPPAAVRSLAKPWSDLLPGTVLRFRLLANASRKIDTATRDGKRSNGQRVPLRTEANALAWLVRKGEMSGFGLVPSVTFPDRPDVAATPHGSVRGARKGGAITVEGVLFEGRLRVDDVGAFVLALQRGIGPGKAYGFGLLSIAQE